MLLATASYAPPRRLRRLCQVAQCVQGKLDDGHLARVGPGEARRRPSCPDAARCGGWPGREGDNALRGLAAGRAGRATMPPLPTSDLEPASRRSCRRAAKARSTQAQYTNS